MGKNQKNVGIVKNRGVDWPSAASTHLVAGISTRGGRGKYAARGIYHAVADASPFGVVRGGVPAPGCPLELLEPIVGSLSAQPKPIITR